MGKRDLVPKLREVYGAMWPYLILPVQVEIGMIRKGGRFKLKSGKEIGNGLEFHMKRLISLIWPEIQWHKWNELILKQWCDHHIIGITGPASSGKTCTAALISLADYYCFPDQTTVLCTSTEREMLEMKLFGEIKAFHKKAKSRFEFLPGTLIESRQRIATDRRDYESEGRDFRNGICGVPCKKGGTFVGLGSFVGIKNKRLRLVADEGNLMPRVYVDAISNLAKNSSTVDGFKCMVMGNPMGIDNGLAMVCEPSARLGFWDGGVDQTGGTKTWDTRFQNGICVQLVGSDGPNSGAKAGEEPYPYLIKDTDIAKDEAFYGKDSWQFLAMDEGRMPRGQGSKRVITRQMCLKCGAMEEPTWEGGPRTSIGFMDAAYSGVGGDRCVFGELQFGPALSLDGKDQVVKVIALMDTTVVPVTMDETMTPEDQIAAFVMEQCNRRGIPPSRLFFDSTGRGSLMNAFGRLWSPEIRGIEFGGRPTKRPVSADIQMPCDEHYFNMVSELWYSVRLVIEARQFRGMTEEMLQEGCFREWGMVSGRKVQVEPKEKMKVKMGRSPDLFDALACGVEGARRSGFQILRLSNSARWRPEGGDWRDKLRERAFRLAPRQLDYSA